MPVLTGKYIVPKFENGIDYTQTRTITSSSYWIFASRGDNMVRLNSTNLETSTDGGTTWGNTTAFANYTNLLHGWIFSNDNVALFTKDNKIYLTTLSLGTITEKTLYESDGTTPYTFHTPSNATYPGAYLECESHMNTTSGTDIYVLANYCNSGAIDSGGRGASAVIVPFSDDYGATWKVSYEFGQNLVYEDDGTASGSSSGTTLGNGGNTNVCRHTHNIDYDSVGDKFYMNTGDQNWTFTTPDMDEIGWYEGTYSAGSISWSRIDFGVTIEKTNRLKGTGFFFRTIEATRYIYWASDANPSTVDDEQGIWRAPLSTFDTPATHEKVFYLTKNFPIIDMKVDENTGIVLCTVQDLKTGGIDILIAVKDYGHGASDFYRFNNSPTLLRLNSPNSDGYWRIDIGAFTPAQTDTYLIKIGDNLFKDI